MHICANMGMFDMVFVWVKPYYECNRVKVQTPFFYPFSFSYGMTMAQYIKNEERPETKAIPQQSHHQEERIIAKSTPMEVVSKEWNCCEGIGS